MSGSGLLPLSRFYGPGSGGNTSDLSVEARMIAYKDPEVGLSINLSQGTILPGNPKLINWRAVMFKCSWFLSLEGWMPRILKEQLKHRICNFSDGFR